MIETVAEVMMYVAGIISLIGAIGMIRFPDFYTRNHAATMINVGGVSLALFAIFLIQAFQLSAYSWKILFVIALLMLVNPTNSHTIALAAYKTGIRPRNLVREGK